MKKGVRKLLTFLLVFSMIAGMGVSFADGSFTVSKYTTLTGVSTNKQSVAVKAWYDSSENLYIAAASNFPLEDSMRLVKPGYPDITGYSIGVYTSLKLNDNAPLNPADFTQGNTNPAEWRVYKFNSNILVDGEYSIDAKSLNQGKGHDISGQTVIVNDPILSITVTAKSATKEYDGTALLEGGHILSGEPLISGDSINVTVTGTITNVGTVTNEVTEVVIMRGSVDVTDKYDITEIDGELEVTPKPVTIVVNDSSKVFGEADPEFTGTVSGLLGTDDLNVAYSRTNSEINAVGVYPNVLDASYTPNVNYDVTVTRGDFEIVSADGAQLSITDYSGVYDGVAHKIEVGNLITGDTVLYSTDNATWSETNPGFTDVSINTVYVKVTNPSYNDRTGTGTVTITPKPVTIVVNDSSKVFGEADPEFTGTVSGLLGTDDLNVAYSRTNSEINAVGVYPNVLDASYTPNVNYAVTVIKGDFEITEKEVTTIYYTVTYAPGTQGTFEPQVTENLVYGATTPSAPATPGNTGYTFNGWSPVPTAKVNGNATYTAQWRADTPPPPPPQIYNLTIVYVYSFGDTARPAHNAQLRAGQTYRVITPTIPGYTPNADVVAGTMPEDSIRVVVTYTRIPTTTERDRDPRPEVIIPPEQLPLAPPPVEVPPVVIPPVIVEVVPTEPLPQAPILPRTGTFGAGEAAGIGALLMAIGLMLKKKKED